MVSLYTFRSQLRNKTIQKMPSASQITMTSNPVIEARSLIPFSTIGNTVISDHTVKLVLYHSHIHPFAPVSTIDRTVIDGHTVKLIIEDLITSKPDATPIPTLTLFGGFGPNGKFLWHNMRQEISHLAASNYNWMVSAASWRQINLDIDHYITSGRGGNNLQGSVVMDNESEDECITEVMAVFHRNLPHWWEFVCSQPYPPAFSCLKRT